MTPSAGQPGVWAVVLLSALAAIGPLTFSIFPPAVAQTASDLDVTAAAIQATLSAYLIMLGLSQPVYGPFIDRFGRKRPLLAGFFIFIAGSALCAFAQSAGHMMTGRVLQALGVCAGMVSARALVRDWFGPERAPVAMAGLSAGMSAAPSLAPLLGGLLADHVGWRSIFWWLMACGAVMIVLAWRFVPVLPMASGGQRMAVVASYRRLFGSRLYMGLVGSLGLHLGAFFAFLTEAPFVFSNQFGMSATMSGLFFSIPSMTFMASALLCARLLRRYSVPNLLVIANVATGVIALWPIFKLLTGDLTALDLLLSTALATLFHGVIFPAAQSTAIGIDARIVGTAAGLMGTLQMVSSGVLVTVVGLLHDGTAMPAVAILCVPTLFAAALGCWGDPAGK